MPSHVPSTPATARRVGISLMEIVVAIAVIALLAGVLTPMVGNVIEDGRRVRARDDCKAICDAICAYQRDQGAYPPGVQGNDTYNYAHKAWTGTGAEVLNQWLFEGKKKYLKKPIANDPWGQSYSYAIYAAADPYMDVVVSSGGPNKTFETWWDWTTWNRGRFTGDDIGALFDLPK